MGTSEELTPKKGCRRGYPVASLVGFEEGEARIWSVFSKVIKPLANIRIEGNSTDSKALYSLYEQTIDALRPIFKEGVRSVVLVSPARTNFSTNFRNHVNRHHSWLVHGPAKLAFAEISGSAGNFAQVTALARNPDLRKVIDNTMAEETTNLLELLEARLNADDSAENVLYSVQEAETAIIYSKTKNKPEYLFITEGFFAKHHYKGRLNKLVQVANNSKVKTRIVKSDSPAGNRLSQLGGFVCLLKAS